MVKKYQKHTDAFKEEVVRRAIERRKPVREIARELGLNPQLIYKWKRQLDLKEDSPSKPKQAVPSPSLLVVNKPELEEIKRLQKQIEKLEAEKDILKKAAAYFAKELV